MLSVHVDAATSKTDRRTGDFEEKGALVEEVRFPESDTGIGHSFLPNDPSHGLLSSRRAEGGSRYGYIYTVPCPRAFSVRPGSTIAYHKERVLYITGN